MDLNNLSRGCMSKDITPKNNDITPKNNDTGNTFGDMCNKSKGFKIKTIKEVPVTNNHKRNSSQCSSKVIKYNMEMDNRRQSLGNVKLNKNMKDSYLTPLEEREQLHDQIIEEEHKRWNRRNSNI